jgi:RHS repeat-associated protein
MNVAADLRLEASLDAIGRALCAANPRVKNESKIGGVGNLAEWLDYAPYGSVIASENTGTTTAARQYIGQYFDPLSNLNYLNSRYYNGAQGQFLSEDPAFLRGPEEQNIQDPQSLNAYSYSEDNPITESDPNGKQCVECAGGEVALSLSAQASYDSIFGQSGSAVYGGDVVASAIYGFAYPWTLVAPEPIAAASAAAGNVAQQGLEYLSGDSTSYDPSETQTAATVAFGSQLAIGELPLPFISASPLTKRITTQLENGTIFKC